MVWLLLLLGAGALVWFLVAPRRFQTLENTPEVVDRRLKAHPIVETTEDPREVRPITERAREVAQDVPPAGHGDSLTFDWPNDQSEHHGSYEHEGPLNPQ